MANPYQQQVRLRKWIYIGLIPALFTVSLMHRKFVLEPMAEEMQLRETARGEVELASSAVRLTLTGSRGLAVTFLWHAALKEQDRQKWNEVELLVGSITKLQPYFITPWLFQSWNLAFNVSVENDKPRDKYYYVSRGMQLLAEGERRNQGKLVEGKPRFPGNPEMRYQLGFYYQLKIGTSDEKHAMQCLLDLSCIDPERRKPELFAGTGQEVNVTEFKKFCEKNPRLVRRLREELDYTKPDDVVRYLQDNYVLPARFSYKEKTLERDSVLEPARTQFPIMPPPQLGDGTYPDPDSREFTNEALDVFLLSRTWYKYAQLPLPPSSPDPGVREPEFDPVRHRLPKMTVMIFRTYPARAQEFIAATLAEEGWFDNDGWVIRDWFDVPEGVQVGTENKYHSGAAWAAAYQAYRDYGIQNGLYLSDQERLRLEQEAQPFRSAYGVHPGDRKQLPPEANVGEMAKSNLAHLKLAWCDHYRHLTNYDDHLYEAEAEKDPEAVYAKKLFFFGNKLRRTPRSVAYFEEAIPIWLDVLLRFPRFANMQTVQEDAYEQELHYLRELQRQRSAFLGPFAIATARLATPPFWPWNTMLTPDKEGVKTLEQATGTAFLLRKFRGPLDGMITYRSFLPRELKQTLHLWSQAGLPAPLSVLPYCAALSGTPAQSNLLLTNARFLAEARPGTNWAPLIDPGVVRMIRERMGIKVQ